MIAWIKSAWSHAALRLASWNSSLLALGYHEALWFPVYIKITQLVTGLLPWQAAVLCLVFLLIQGGSRMISSWFAMKGDAMNRAERIAMETASVIRKVPPK